VVSCIRMLCWYIRRFLLAIASGLASMSSKERSVIRHFIDGVLSKNLEPAEIEAIWRQSGAHVGPSNSRGVIAILTTIRGLAGDLPASGDQLPQ